MMNEHDPNEARVGQEPELRAVQEHHEHDVRAEQQPAPETAAFPELGEYQRRFESLQAEFIDEPRAAVHKAESLIEEAVDRMMHSLRERLREIHDRAGSDGDTEQMRIAMRGYRDVINSLGGRTR